LNSSIKTVKNHETYRESICVRIFLLLALPFAQNESKYVGAGKEFFGNPFGWFQ
jgi:hypothetical protein